jgi:hypothetical protein
LVDNFEIFDRLFGLTSTVVDFAMVLSRFLASFSISFSASEKSGEPKRAVYFSFNSDFDGRFFLVSFAVAIRNSSSRRSFSKSSGDRGSPYHGRLPPIKVDPPV